MKILIVNGYPNTVQGQQQFANFEKTIKDVFKNMKEMVDTEIEFYIRDRNFITEFLYEVDSAYVRLEAGKYFDQVDIVFFEGDPKIRPWAPLANTLLILIRMCLRSNKILFASGFAMQALVFLIASNTEKSISIINGINGGALGDLSKLDKPLNMLKQSDLFLDNVTGDLYGFNYETGEWASKGNAGIHYRRAAEEFKTLGKYIIKAPQYKTKRIKELEQLYVSKSNETVCYIRKNCMHHYMLHGLPFEFLVPFKNTWDVHPFNFVNPKKTFVTLADGEKGPMMIEVTDNIVATQFEVDPKYSETVQVLKNFIIYQLCNYQKVCSNQGRGVPIELASVVRTDNVLDLLLEQQAKMKSQADQKQVKQQLIKFDVITEFHHAGFATRKDGTLKLVTNNAIGHRTMKQDKDTKTSGSILANIDKYTAAPKHQSLQFQTKELLSLGSTQQSESKIEEHKFNKTKSEIRAMLHPEYDRQLLPKKEPIWVPGSMALQHHLGSTVKLNQTSSTIRRKRRQDLSDIDECRSKPIIRNASPYITMEEMNRLHEKEQDKKIIGHKKFICNVPQPQFISNYVTRTPSQPASLHQFRSTQKQNWVGSDNFRLC